MQKPEWIATESKESSFSLREIVNTELSQFCWGNEQQEKVLAIINAEARMHCEQLISKRIRKHSDL